ncbi:MAG: ferredoxin:thioredoxin reductase [Methanomicrobiales archaeon]|nr:ferredoxin:thioredoxin reductase [Methanomicrobiales archaeon]NYT20285.1 ferredoxin:thioredoxin reductase [Methanomicrobiales archaeon]
MERNALPDRPEEVIPAWPGNSARYHGRDPKPDRGRLRTVIPGLPRNRRKFDARPSRIRSGDTENGRGMIGPCIRHADDAVHEDHCHCTLFSRRTWQKSGED